MALSKVERVGEVFWMDDHGNLWPDYLNRGNANSFVLHQAKRFCNGRGIDVGAGQWPYPGAVPIELKNGRDGTDLSDIADDSLDYVFSSHCLEHLTDPQAALRLWVRKLKVGGTVFLYLPHPLMTPWRPGGEWVGGGHKFSPDPQQIVTWLWDAGANEIGRCDGPDAYWSFWVAARKRDG
jgi:SAM-dependent methyltransferase